MNITKNIMKYKYKLEGVCFILWIAVMLFYRILLIILKQNQLECREWVSQLHFLLIWVLPLFIIGSLIWRLHQNSQEHQALSLGAFVIYCIIAVLVILTVSFVGLFLQTTTEFTMDDGNYEISVSGGFLAETTHRYYAEPVTIFARKPFEWDETRYAKSLSKIYDAEFQYVGKDEQGNPQFTSPAYYDIAVTVYGIQSHKINNDLNYLITAHRLQTEWDKCMTPTLALIIYPDNIEAAAKDIVSFIKGECKNAKRADGKPLYENINGSIYLLFKESESAEKYIGTRNIPYGTGSTYSWIHNEKVTVEEIIADLEYQFQCYYDSPYR